MDLGSKVSGQFGPGWRSRGSNTSKPTIAYCVCLTPNSITSCFCELVDVSYASARERESTLRACPAWRGAQPAAVASVKPSSQATQSASKWPKSARKVAQSTRMKLMSDESSWWRTLGPQQRGAQEERGRALRIVRAVDARLLEEASERQEAALEELLVVGGEGELGELEATLDPVKHVRVLHPRGAARRGARRATWPLKRAAIDGGCDFRYNTRKLFFPSKI
jgi:hypothetical protein